MTSKKDVWFPAKKNGWGWGKPVVWQGWVVMVSYLLTITLFSYVYDPKTELFNWSVAVGACTLVLIAMYIWKGEAPSWTWKAIEKDKRRWFK